MKGKLVRVVVITMTGFKRFCQVGGDDSNSPRLPLAYPYYGYLKEKGIFVELFSLKNQINGEDIGQYRNLNGYFKVIPFTKYFASFDFIVVLGTIGPYLANILRTLSANKKVFTLVFANSSSLSPNFWNKIKDCAFTNSLKACGGILYMTQEQKDYAAKNLQLPLERLYHLPLGVDTKFFTPLSVHKNVLDFPLLSHLPQMKYVVIAGDQLRDEHKIAKIMDGIELKLIRLTQSENIEKFWQKWNQEHDNANVFCKANLSFQEVRYVYQHALCVLNLVDNSWQPAGWTVATEAMACGVPVIMNSGLVTRELKHYQDFPPFIEISSIPEVAEVRKELKKLSIDYAFAKNLGQSSRKFVEDNLQIEKTGDCLLKIFQSQLIKL